MTKLRPQTPEELATGTKYRSVWMDGGNMTNELTKELEESEMLTRRYMCVYINIWEPSKESFVDVNFFHASHLWHERAIEWSPDAIGAVMFDRLTGKEIGEIGDTFRVRVYIARNNAQFAGLQ